MHAMISRVTVQIIRFFLIFCLYRLGEFRFSLWTTCTLHPFSQYIFKVRRSVLCYLHYIFELRCGWLLQTQFKEYSLLITSSCIFHLTAVRYVFRILHVRSKTTHYMFAYQLKVFIMHSFIFMRKKSSTLVFFLQHDASCDVIAYTIVFKMEFFFKKNRVIFIWIYERY